jgi:hypothetical protein
MTQPNVYWTLTSPLLTIVGIHDNAVEEGYLALTLHDRVGCSACR